MLLPNITENGQIKREGIKGGSEAGIPKFSVTTPEKINHGGDLVYLGQSRRPARTDRKMAGWKKRL